MLGKHEAIPMCIIGCPQSTQDHRDTFLKKKSCVFLSFFLTFLTHAKSKKVLGAQ